MQTKIRAEQTNTDSATQTLTNKTLTSPVINTGISGTAIDTTTTLGTSDTKIPSQKAVKTYVDDKTPSSAGSLVSLSSYTIQTTTKTTVASFSLSSKPSGRLIVFVSVPIRVYGSPNGYVELDATGLYSQQQGLHSIEQDVSTASSQFVKRYFVGFIPSFNGSATIAVKAAIETNSTTNYIAVGTTADSRFRITMEYMIV